MKLSLGSYSSLPPPAMHTNYLLILLIISPSLFFSSGDLFTKGPANPGQQVFVGIEFGLPYDLANTLSNPLGRTLTSLSVLGIAVFFFMGLLIVPYQMMFATFESSERTKRAASWSSFPHLMHIKDGFWLIQEEDMSCRKRAVVILQIERF